MLIISAYIPFKKGSIPPDKVQMGRVRNRSCAATKLFGRLIVATVFRIARDISRYISYWTSESKLYSNSSFSVATARLLYVMIRGGTETCGGIMEGYIDMNNEYAPVFTVGYNIC
jgi:hypothetical protein